MKLYPWSATGFVATLLLFTSAVNAEWGLAEGGPSTILASAFCENYNISGPATVAGDTSGSYGAMEAGDTFTFTATGNGTGTWRIVGDAGGDPSYTAGGTFPGTLTYVVPAGGLTTDGMGYYVDSYTGTGDTISGTCGDAASASAPVPSLSVWSRILVVVLIGLFGFAAFQRKRQREHS